MIYKHTEEYIRSEIKRTAIAYALVSESIFVNKLYNMLKDFERGVGGLSRKGVDITNKDEIAFCRLFAYGIAFHAKNRLIQSIMKNRGDEDAES